MTKKSNLRIPTLLCACAAALLLIGDLEAYAQNQKRSEAYFMRGGFIEARSLFILASLEAITFSLVSAAPTFSLGLKATGLLDPWVDFIACSAELLFSQSALALLSGPLTFVLGRTELLLPMVFLLERLCFFTIQS